MIAHEVVIQLYLILAVLSEAPSEQDPGRERLLGSVGDTSVSACTDRGLTSRVADKTCTTDGQQDVGSEAI